jgi:signal transduction histidine kinase
MARNPEQVERYGALIQKESGRLNDMVEQILRFATAEAGRVIEEREPLSIGAVMEEAVAANRSLIEGAQCVVERNIAPGLPLVLGDRVALRHALENLVANAAKHGLKGGNWIGVSAARIAARTGGPARDAVEILVADHGAGIPPEEQARIFDPFFRGARAMEDQIRGTGLGLSLVKRIIEAHGGSIRVESQPDKGTAFILRLPAAPPASEAPTLPAAPIAPPAPAPTALPAPAAPSAPGAPPAPAPTAPPSPAAPTAPPAPAAPATPTAPEGAAG